VSRLLQPKTFIFGFRLQASIYYIIALAHTSYPFGGEFRESRNANRFRLSLFVGAWIARNFSAHYAGSLGYLSDHLSLNALSLSATVQFGIGFSSKHSMILCLTHISDTLALLWLAYFRPCISVLPLL